MANLMGESKTLAGKFVFYEQLAQSQNPTAQMRYAAATEAGRNLLSIKDSSSRARTIAQLLRAQAMSEAAKEAALLNEQFHCNFTVSNMFDKDIAKQITLSMNEALNMRDVFERNVARLLNDKGNTQKVTITSVMEGYLVTELRAQWGKIMTEIGKNTFEKGMELEQATDEVFSSQIMDSVLNNTLERVLKSSTFDKGEDLPFQELAQFLDKRTDQKTYILQKMSTFLGIDKLRDTLKQQIKNTQNLEQFKRNTKNNPINVETTIIKGTQKGLMAEAMSVVLAEASRKFNNGNVKFNSGEQVGSYGGRTDVTIGFGVNVSEISKILNKYTGASRETNRQRMLEISDYLKRLKKGFIVYSNVKDYTIGQDFEKRGFRGVEQMSLRKYNDMMFRTKSNEMIGAIANTIDGAIFHGRNYKEALTEFIAADMAKLLFDDVYIVGKEMTKGATAIHVLNLDGIYIPVSYMLLLLAEAFEKEDSKSYKDIFSPSINSNMKIAYPDGGEEGVGIWTNEDWKKQRDLALDGITISANFMKSFVDIVRELM